MAKVKPIPDGYHNVTPYLVVDGAAKAIDFYKKVFGADREDAHAQPRAARMGHAELTLGDSMIMLADEHPEMGTRGAARRSAAPPVSLMVYVPDVDATVNDRASPQARRSSGQVENQFYGDRMGDHRGSVRAPLVRRHPRRGRAAGRDGEAGGRRDGQVQLGPS